MRANSVRMSNTMGTAGDEEGPRGCSVALIIEVAACVARGERESG